MDLERYQHELPPRRRILPGGAVLLETPMPGAHSVSVGVWLRRGSRDEPVGLGGLLHFLEHIVFKGSQSRSAYEIAAGFDALGASVDAYTTKDQVAFTVKVLPEYFPAALALLADMVLRPALDPEQIALEQEVVCEEIQEALDTPEDRLHDAFAAHVFGDHPRGRPILGTPDSVNGFTADLLRREHRRLFASSELILSLAGNLQPHFADLVAEAFAGAADEKLEPVPAAGVPAIGSVAPSLRLEGPIVQTYFEIGNVGVSYLHEDRIPVYVLSHIMGGGMSSRIFQAVREREGLAYTVYTYTDMGRDTGLVSCAGACSPDKEERLREVVRLEYTRLLAEGVVPEELATNKAQIKSQLVFSLEGVSNQMGRAAKNEYYFGRFMPLVEVVGKVDAVTRDDIARCAETFFSPDRMVAATHGPADGAAPEGADDDA
jgi:predicted Zn-dependent peptidase